MKDAKANCQQPADSFTCNEGGGDWQNGRNGHPSAAQLAVEMVPLVSARPPPALLLVASGRASTTLTVTMALAAAAVVARVTGVTVADERSRSAGQEATTANHLFERARTSSSRQALSGRCLFQASRWDRRQVT